MSVIGPRPGLWNQDILTAERDKYNANDVKPGLEKHCEVVLEEPKQIRFGIDLIISNEDRPRFTITTCKTGKCGKYFCSFTSGRCD